MARAAVTHIGGAARGVGRRPGVARTRLARQHTAGAGASSRRSLFAQLAFCAKRRKQLRAQGAAGAARLQQVTPSSAPGASQLLLLLLLGPGSPLLVLGSSLPRSLRSSLSPLLPALPFPGPVLAQQPGVAQGQSGVGISF
uniref:Uncharacterized protein n=1 Tax=Sphaerodactylus townsendi TaxID=933632 RepID=A0ACB8GFP1_9SAUR